MMERTELREQFFAEVHRDPYAHLILHHVAEAWVDGYEQALRDNGLTDEWFRKSRRDHHQNAIDRLTADRNKAAAEAIIALADIGRLIGVPKLGGETP